MPVQWTPNAPENATWLTAARWSRFLHQLSILGFTLRERSPGPDVRALGAGKDWHLQQNEVAMEDRLLYRVPELAVILNISRSKV
jgi:hypothetical protein